MAHWLDTYYRGGRVGDPTTAAAQYKKLMQAAQLAANKQKGTTVEAQYRKLVKQAAHDDKVYKVLEKEAMLQQNDKPHGTATVLTGTAGEVWKALVNAGIPDPPLKFVFILCYMESGGFTNGPSRNDYNPGNIMWYPGMTKGTYVAANRTYAIHFRNFDEFARELKKTLSKGARPIGADTLTDFVHRLKLNNYMGNESEASYLAKMRGAQQRLRLQGQLQDDANQTVTDSGRNKKKLSVWVWVGVAAAGVLVIRGISK